MIRILIALVIGAVLAVGASAVVINVAAPSAVPVNQPLYNYGNR